MLLGILACLNLSIYANGRRARYGAKLVWVNNFSKAGLILSDTTKSSANFEREEFREIGLR